YRCCQNGKHGCKHKKVADPTKQRDHESMEAFECQGWIHLTIDDRQPKVHVKVSHAKDHVPYTYVNIPDDIRTMVASSPHMMVSQV
ncbi:hypothetical protein OBBRIDRAFT_712975, partial [Obba rivulosa]